MADRNLSVKFGSEGLSETINNLKKTAKLYDEILAKSQAAMRQSVIAAKEAEDAVDPGAYEKAQRERARAAQRVNKIIAASFRELRISSVADIEQQKKQAIAAYEAIRKSGLATAKDLENAQFALNKKLDSLNAEINLTVDDRAGEKFGRGFAKESQKYTDKFLGELGKSFKEIGGGGIIGGLGRAVTAPFRLMAVGALEGIGRSFSDGIGKGAAKAFEKRTGQNLEEVGATIEKRTVAVAERVLTRFSEALKFEDGLAGLVKEFDGTNEFINDALVDFAGDIGDTVADILLGEIKKIPDRLKSAGRNIGGAALKVGTTPLRARNQLLAQQAADQLQELSSKVRIPADQVSKISSADSIVLVTGGLAGGRGGAENALFNKAFAEAAFPSSYVEAVYNPFLNDFETDFKDGLLKLLKDLGVQIPKDMEDGFAALGGEGDLEAMASRIAKMIELAALKGIDPDALAMAARAMAFRQQYPDKPIQLIANSGGGWNVANAIDYLNRAGIQNVRGVGQMTPFTGLSRNLPKNFTSMMGTADQFYQGFFDRFPGLFRPAPGMQIFPDKNPGHSLDTFFRDDEIRDAFFRNLGIFSPNPSDILTGQPAFVGRFKPQNDRHIEGSIQRAFGGQATYGHLLQKDNPLGALEAIPYWQQALSKSMRPANLKRMSAQTREILMAYSELLETMDREFRLYHQFQGEYLPLESLRIGSQIYPGLEPLKAEYYTDENIKANQKLLADADVLKGDLWQGGGIDLEDRKKALEFVQQFGGNIDNFARTIAKLQGKALQPDQFAFDADSLNGFVTWLVGFRESIKEIDALTNSFLNYSFGDFESINIENFIGFITKLSQSVSENELDPTLINQFQQLFGFDPGLVTARDYYDIRQQDLNAPGFFRPPITVSARSVPDDDAQQSAPQQPTPPPADQPTELKTPLLDLIPVNDLVESAKQSAAQAVGGVVEGITEQLQEGQTDLREGAKKLTKAAVDTATNITKGAAAVVGGTVEGVVDAAKDAVVNRANQIQGTGQKLLPGEGGQQGDDLLRALFAIASNDTKTKLLPALGQAGNLIGGGFNQAWNFGKRLLGARNQQAQLPGTDFIDAEIIDAQVIEQLSGTNRQLLEAVKNVQRLEQEIAQLSGQGEVLALPAAQEGEAAIADTSEQMQGLIAQLREGRQAIHDMAGTLTSWLQTSEGMAQSTEEDYLTLYIAIQKINESLEASNRIPPNPKYEAELRLLRQQEDKLQRLRSNASKVLTTAARARGGTGTDDAQLRQFESFQARIAAIQNVLKADSDVGRQYNEILQRLKSGSKDLINDQVYDDLNTMIRLVETLTIDLKQLNQEIQSSDLPTDLKNQLTLDQRQLGRKRSEVLGTVRDYGPAIKELAKAGDQAAEGFRQGFKAKSEAIYKAGTDTVKNLISNIKASLGIQSPSRVMAWIGNMMGLGLIKGLAEKAPDFRKSLNDFFSPDSIERAIETDPSGPINQLTDELFSGFNEFVDGLGEKFPLFEKLRGFLGDIAANYLQFLGVFSAGDAFIQMAMTSLETTRRIQDLERVIKSLSGSLGEAQSNIKFVRQEAKRLGLDVAASLESFGSLLAATQNTALQGQATRDIFTAVSEASMVMGVDAQSQQRAFLAIQQIISKNRLTAEEVRQQLAEALPGSQNTLARALGVSPLEFNRLLESGTLNPADVIPQFTAQLRAESAAGVVAASDSATASINRMNSALTNLSANFGETFQPAQVTVVKGLTGVFDGLATAAQELGKLLLTLLLAATWSLIAGLTKLTLVSQGLGLAWRTIVNVFNNSLVVFRAVIAKALLLYAAFEVINNVAKVAGDQFPETTEALKNIDKQFGQLQTSIARARGELQEFVKDLPKNSRDLNLGDGLFQDFFQQNFGMDGLNLEGVRRFFGLRTLAESRQDQFTINSQELISRGDQAVNELPNLRREIQEILDLEQQLNQIRSERAALQPGDREGLERNLAREQALIERVDNQREATSRYSALIESQIQAIDKQLETLEGMRQAGSITEEVYTRDLQALESQRANLRKAKNEFDGLISSVARGLSLLERRMRNLNETLAAIRENLQIGTDQRRTNLLRQFIESNGIQEVLDVRLQVLDLDQLQETIEALSRTMRQIDTELNSGVLGAAYARLSEQATREGLDLNSTATLQRLQQEQERPGDERAVIAALLTRRQAQQELAGAESQFAGGVNQMRNQIRQYEQQIRDQRRQMSDTIRDLNRSVRDYFFNLALNIRQTLLDIERLRNQIAQGRLRRAFLRAMLPGSDNFANTLVQSFQELMDRVFEVTGRLFDAQASQIEAERQENDLNNQFEDFLRGLRDSNRGLADMQRELSRSVAALAELRRAFTSLRGQVRPSQAGNAVVPFNLQPGRAPGTPTGTGQTTPGGVFLDRNAGVISRLGDPFSPRPTQIPAWLRGMIGEEFTRTIESNQQLLRQVLQVLPNQIPAVNTMWGLVNQVLQLINQFGPRSMAPKTAGMRGEYARQQQQFGIPQDSRNPLLSTLGRSLVNQRPDAFDLNSPEGRARLAIAMAIAGTETRGRYGNPNINLGQIYGIWGGSGNRMKGPFQLNTKYHAQEASTMRSQNDFVADVLMGRRRTPDHKERADFGAELARLIQSGEITNPQQFQRWLGRRLGYDAGGRSWQALSDGFTGPAAGLQNTLFSWLQSGGGQPMAARQATTVNPEPQPQQAMAITPVQQQPQVMGEAIARAIDWVSRQRESGVTEDRIAQQLKQAGWNLKDLGLEESAPQLAQNTQAVQENTQALNGIVINVPPPETGPIAPQPTAFPQPNPRNQAEVEAAARPLISQQAGLIRQRAGLETQAAIEEVQALPDALNQFFESIQRQIEQFQRETQRGLEDDAAELTQLRLQYQLPRASNQLASDLEAIRQDARQRMRVIEDKERGIQERLEAASRAYEELSTSVQSYLNSSNEAERIQAQIASQALPFILEQLQKLGLDAQAQLGILSQQRAQIQAEISRAEQFTQTQGAFAIAEEQLQRQGVGVSLQGQLAEAQAQAAQARGFDFAAAQLQRQNALLQEQQRYREQILQIQQQFQDDIAERDRLIALAEQVHLQNIQNLKYQYQDLATTLETTVRGAFEQFFSDVFTNTKSIEDALMDLVRNVLTQIANILARLASAWLMKSFEGLFGGLLGGGGGFLDWLGGGGIQGFAMGGTVPAVDKALRKEGPRGVLAVFTPGEEILSLRTGEAQRYQALKSQLGDNPLSRIRQAVVENFADGGTVDGMLLANVSSGYRKVKMIPSWEQQRGSKSERTGNTIIQMTVNTPDANSFRKSELQIGRDLSTQAERARRRS